MEKIIFDDGIKQIIDIGIKDIFNNKCYLSLMNNNYNGIIGNNKEYNKNRKALDKIGCKNVIVPKYLQVIDFDKQTIEKIKKYVNISDEYIKSNLQVWN